VRDYAWLEDEPVGTVDTGPQPTQFAWIHTDRLGTPLAVTSSPASGNAATIWRASYAAFGLAAVNEDPDGDTKQYMLDLRFPGQRWDAESGAHYNWHRYYDPSMGRYISADPIGQVDGINIFQYASANPANEIDPYGPFGCSDIPNVPQSAVNLSAGFGDALLLGLGDELRDLSGAGDFVDPCSDAYGNGELAALAAGVGRLAYAAVAKAGAAAAASGAAANAVRNSLKGAARLGAAKGYRAVSYGRALEKYGSDAAVRAAAGRTDPFFNALGAGVAAAAGVGPDCECRQ
jgi:RHS repeat-associated protein